MDNNDDLSRVNRGGGGGRFDSWLISFSVSGGISSITGESPQSSLLWVTQSGIDLF